MFTNPQAPWIDRVDWSRRRQTVTFAIYWEHLSFIDERYRECAVLRVAGARKTLRTCSKPYTYIVLTAVKSDMTIDLSCTERDSDGYQKAPRQSVSRVFMTWCWFWWLSQQLVHTRMQEYRSIPYFPLRSQQCQVLCRQTLKYYLQMHGTLETLVILEVSLGNWAYESLFSWRRANLSLRTSVTRLLCEYHSLKPLTDPPTYTACWIGIWKGSDIMETSVLWCSTS